MSSTAAKEALERIVGSRQFRNAPRLSSFLSFVVEEALAGRSERIKGYTIGVEVFGKDENFNPETDTIVRVQARALRQKLDEYYLRDGANDDVRITIPKGGYEPEFHLKSEYRHPVPSPEPATGSSGQQADAELTKPSIAVLPFENLGARTEFDYLSVGLTEGVIFDLSRFKYLSVFSRATMQEAKEQGLSTRQIRSQLRTDFILESSFRANEDAIETFVKLIDAASDTILTAFSVNMKIDPDHLYSMQDEICLRVAACLGVDGSIGHFAQRAMQSRPEYKWETYAALSRFFEYGPRLDERARDEIHAELSHAAQADPGFSETHAALAMIDLEFFTVGTPDVGDPERLAQAMEHAMRAVQCDPQSALAHQAMALVQFHAGDFTGFQASIRRALDLNPGHGDMLTKFGWCFARRGLWDEAMPLLDRALTLNPLHPDWYHLPKSILLMMTKGPDEALAELTKRPVPEFLPYHLNLLWFWVEARDMDRALEEKQQLLALAPEVEGFATRYFCAIGLCDEIADRMTAAFRIAELNIS